MGTTSIAVCPTEYDSKETVLQHPIISEEGTFPPFRGLFYFQAQGDLLVRGRSDISAPCRLQSTAVLWI